MADTLTKEQFPNICRCCLVPRDKKNPQFPLFLQHGLYGRYARNTNASLLEIISGCLGITVSKSSISLCYQSYYTNIFRGLSGLMVSIGGLTFTRPRFLKQTRSPTTHAKDLLGEKPNTGCIAKIC